MTTTVRVLIEGNKACQVKVTSPSNAATDPVEVIVKPGQFATKTIHGDQTVTVTEIGEFV